MIYASPPYSRCWQNLEFSAAIILECYLATKLYFILNHIVNFWDLNWPSKQFAVKISINNRILRPAHRTKSCWIVIRFAKLRMMKRDSVKPPGTLVRIEAKPEAVPEVCATPTSCSMEEIFFVCSTVLLHASTEREGEPALLCEGWRENLYVCGVCFGTLACYDGAVSASQ